MRFRVLPYVLTLLAFLFTAAAVPAQLQATPATPTTATRSSAITPAAVNDVFLPYVASPPKPELDLSIDNLEITQSVQRPDNDVPLVAHRPTVVRVYARVSGGSSPQDVKVTLTGSRDGVALTPVTIGPRSVPASVSRAVYTSSFNALLPEEWLSGNVQLSAQIDPANEIPETNEGNNAVSANLFFNQIAPLRIVLVPIRYKHLPTGKTYAEPTQDTISDWIRRTYPVNAVNVSFHAAVQLSGNLNDPNQWDGLVSQIRNMEFQEDPFGPSVYYGLVSAGTSAANSWIDFNNGVILGIGYVGNRASVGLDMPQWFTSLFDLPTYATSETAAHEIGHNLGRTHAPCAPNNTLPSGLDPSYPASGSYAGAHTGEYGTDVFDGVVLTPNDHYDVMSYCDPQWISDYTYQAIFNELAGDPMPRTVTTPPQPSLLVRGSSGSGGIALAPMYATTGRVAVSSAESDYEIEFVGADGTVLATQPAAVAQIEEPHVWMLKNGQLQRKVSPAAVRGMDTTQPQLSFSALVPQPNASVAEVRLLHNKTIVARRAIAAQVPSVTTAGTAAVARQGNLLTLTWNRTAPALVRYTADNGTSWTTLGIDITGGTLTVDATQLARNGTGRFEIAFADGAAPTAVAGNFGTAADAPDNAPRAWITGPNRANVGQPLVLYGQGDDAEDGALAASGWSVDGASVQAGHTLQLDSLAPGKHTIVLTVRDSAGQAATVEHQVLVTP